jgi:hypothetical protein
MTHDFIQASIENSTETVSLFGPVDLGIRGLHVHGQLTLPPQVVESVFEA